MAEFLAISCGLTTIPQKLPPSKRQLFRQLLAPGFHGERNDQEAQAKGDRRASHRRTQTAVVPHAPGDQEIDAGPNKAPKGRCEGKGRGPHAGFVLLRQPQAEHGEITAGKSQEKERAKKYR